MNTSPAFNPVGTPGMPWGEAERAEWLSRQTRQRCDEADKLPVTECLRPRFDVAEYGRLDYGTDSPRTTPKHCHTAQAAVVSAAIDYALTQR